MTHSFFTPMLTTVFFLSLALVRPLSADDWEEYKERTHEIYNKIIKGECDLRIEDATVQYAANLLFLSSSQSESEFLSLSIKLKKDMDYKLAFIIESLSLLRQLMAEKKAPKLIVGDYYAYINMDGYNQLWLPIYALLRIVHSSHPNIDCYHYFFSREDHTPVKDAMTRLELFLAWNIKRNMEMNRVLLGTEDEKKDFWKRDDADTDFLLEIFNNENDEELKILWLKTRLLPDGVYINIAKDQDASVQLRETAEPYSLLALNTTYEEHRNVLFIDFNDCMKKISYYLKTGVIDSTHKEMPPMIDDAQNERKK